MGSCCGNNGNPFVQTLFMGASITQFSASAGWNNSDGGMTVEVVEDKCPGHARLYADGAAGLGVTTEADRFSPPSVGSPVFFFYGGFQVGGILQSWTERNSVDDAKMFSIQIASPNSILAGTPVILSKYDGPTNSVPNLINVHGFLESLCKSCTNSEYSYTYQPMGMCSNVTYQPAPGWCKQSDSGWRWIDIYGALRTLLASGAIHFRGYQYIVDISELPTLNSEIRLGVESKTVLDIIQEVCEIGGVEFFLDLIPQGAAGSCAGNLGKGPHFIKVRVGKSAMQAFDQSAADADSAHCSRVEDRLDLGTVGQTISSSTCVHRASRGLELCTHVVNAFITGNFRQDIWQMDYQGHCDGWSDTIWPYWGKDPWGNVYLGKQCCDPFDTWDAESAHYFDLDISLLNIGINKWRVTSTELRAAIIGESQWRAYLAIIERDKFQQLFKNWNELEGALVNTLNSVAGSIRAKVIDKNKAKTELDDPRWKPADMFSWDRTSIKNFIEAPKNKDDQIENAQAWINASKLYDLIKKYAHEFFGRKFMVKLPFICTDTSGSSDEPWSWNLNWQECDSGWADGSVLGLAWDSWVLEQFRTDDGKIRGFCKFVSGTSMLLDKVGRDNFFAVSPYVVYVGCSVETIVGLTPTDWRAVISLSGPVGAMPNNPVIPEEWQLMHAMLSKAISALKGFKGITNLEWDEFKKLTFHAGHDKSAYGGMNAFIMPVAVAIPLQSKKLVYGPWWANKGGIFSGNDNGTTKYENNQTFSPWGFGSTQNMNSAGMMTAQAYVHDKYVIERGEITFPGAPIGSLGRMISAGGPMITRIDVQVGKGDGQVLTTYAMKTWTPDYGKMGLARAAAIHRAILIGAKAERMERKFALSIRKEQIDQSLWVAKMLDWKRIIGFQGHSSHDFLFGNMFADPESTDWARGTIVSSESRKDAAMLTATDDDDGGAWRRRAYMEQIGMFRPFTTVYDRAIESTDEGRYLCRYSEATPHVGRDAFKKNNPNEPEVPSTPESGASIERNNTYFYPTEQVPPIFCSETNKPISINTLSPFLANEKWILPSSERLWDADSQIKLTQQPSVGHDIEYIARDGVYPTHLSVREDDYSPEHWYRAIALKGPIIMAGWGYDIDNHPVPNQCTKEWQEWTVEEGPTRFFEQDWLRKPHHWKCGPIDLRWDYRRKVWVAPTPMKIVNMVLCDWLLPEQCAKALLVDDMVQWDEQGVGLQLEECGCNSGYRVTVYSKSLRPVPAGWHITAYYDTTNQRYQMLAHDELPILEAIMLEDLHCDGYAEARITGIAGSTSYPGNTFNSIECSGICIQLDLFRTFENLIIKLSNPLRQPICAGRKVFVWVCQAMPQGASFVNNPDITNPTVDGCATYCPSVQCLTGVVLKAEYRPECVVTAVDLIEYEYFGSVETTREYSTKFTPTGSVTGCGVLCGSISGSGSGADTGALSGITSGDFCVDLSDGCFTFTGSECEFTMAVDYDIHWRYYRYDVCVCWRQLFIEAEMGTTVCANGGTPCSCPQTCATGAYPQTYLEWDSPCQYGCSGNPEPIDESPTGVAIDEYNVGELYRLGIECTGVSQCNCDDAP